MTRIRQREQAPMIPTERCLSVRVGMLGGNPSTSALSSLTIPRLLALQELPSTSLHQHQQYRYKRTEKRVRSPESEAAFSVLLGLDRKLSFQQDWKLLQDSVLTSADNDIKFKKRRGHEAIRLWIRKNGIPGTKRTGKKAFRANTKILEQHTRALIFRRAALLLADRRTFPEINKHCFPAFLCGKDSPIRAAVRAKKKKLDLQRNAKYIIVEIWRHGKSSALVALQRKDMLFRRQNTKQLFKQKGIIHNDLHLHHEHIAIRLKLMGFWIHLKLPQKPVANAAVRAHESSIPIHIDYTQNPLDFLPDLYRKIYIKKWGPLERIAAKAGYKPVVDKDLGEIPDVEDGDDDHEDDDHEDDDHDGEDGNDELNDNSHLELGEHNHDGGGGEAVENDDSANNYDNIKTSNDDNDDADENHANNNDDAIISAANELYNDHHLVGDNDDDDDDDDDFNDDDDDGDEGDDDEGDDDEGDEDDDGDGGKSDAARVADGHLQGDDNDENNMNEKGEIDAEAVDVSSDNDNDGAVERMKV